MTVEFTILNTTLAILSARVIFAATVLKTERLKVVESYTYLIQYDTHITV